MLQNIPAFLQYGALGLLALTLVGVGLGTFKVVMIILAAFRESSKVVSENTIVQSEMKEVIRSFKESLNERVDTSNGLIIEVKDLLLSRPCMKKD